MGKIIVSEAEYKALILACIRDLIFREGDERVPLKEAVGEAKALIADFYRAG